MFFLALVLMMAIFMVIVSVVIKINLVAEKTLLPLHAVLYNDDN